jgi:hypothetical protein
MSLFDDDDNWGTVVAGSGDYARVQQLAGHLIIVFPLGYIEHNVTKFTVPGKKSDVIVCDIVDLDDVDETGAPGKIYRTAWWRSAQLIMSLRPLIGKRILGRVVQGVPKNGMNPPWIISDATTDQIALDRAKAWGQAHTNFALSTFTPPPIVVEARPSYGQPPQQPYAQTGYQAPQQQQQQYPQQQYAPPAPPQQGYASPAGHGYGPTQPPQPQYPPQQPPPQQYPPAGPPQQPQYPPQQPPQNYPPPQQQGYPPQQGYPQQPVPAFPVQGAPPPQDPEMLELMRAERARREAQAAQAAQNQWQTEEPPF